MIEEVIGPGEIRAHLPSRSWILVFGGISREGNRRARRAVSRAIHDGFDVVWMDGYAETYDDDPNRRVPLTADAVEGALVIDYSRAERSHFLNRMVQTIPRSIEAPMEAVERRLQASASPAATFATRMRRAVAAVLRKVRKKVLRRISQVCRGVVGWRIVQPDIRTLAVHVRPPSQIVYGDDFALTQAWRAARIWSDAPIGMELKTT